MKKVMVMAALFLGTTAMVNAQTEPAKAAPAKEVKAKKAKKMKAVKMEKKAAAPVAAPAKK